MFAHAYQPGKTYPITILHTNDIHGRYWPNEQGEYGLAAQKTLVDRIKQEVRRKGGSVIILNAGDINTGVPESDLQNARPVIEAMNDIGYEAMTLGNHEFDNPLQIMAMQEKWAKFPFLSANTRWKDNQHPLVSPYAILKKQDLKIAVIGLTTEDTAAVGNPEYTGQITFQQPLEAAQATLKEVAKQKPDLTIALTHIGYYENGEHGSNAPGDVTLARSLPTKSFDIIIGGHSHTVLCLNKEGRLKQDHIPGQTCRPDRQNGSWIMQAGEWGKYLGRADFEFKNGQLKLIDYRLIPVNLKQAAKDTDSQTEHHLYQAAIAPNTTLQTRLQRYQNAGQKLLSEKVGTLTGELEGDRSYVRQRPTNLGLLIARAQRERTRADLAIINSGGIRDSIPSGDVSYKSILQAQPFGNIVSYIDMKGRDLAEYLQTVGLKTPGSGGYPQLDNVSFEVNYAKQTVSNIKIGGEPLQADKTYRLSIPSYLAAGGDGYPKVSGRPGYVNTGFVDAEILKQYFQQHAPINAAEYAPGQPITVQK